jgi:hypothetical protein
VLNAVLGFLTQKAQKIFKEVNENCANKKPTLWEMDWLKFCLAFCHSDA